MDDNVTRQAEEIEALCSIYGDQWHTEDEYTPEYSICLTEAGKSVTLYLTLPTDYPSQAPPLYQMSAPLLNRLDKDELAGRMENIYLDNIGENILYQWVEAVREFLEEKGKLKSVVNSVEITTEDDINIANISLEDNSTHSSREEVPHITHGETITDRKSIFQGHVATVTSADHVKKVLGALMQKKKIAQATHNIYAYRFTKQGQPSCVVQDCEDDGETAAGSRLLHLLQIMDVMNVIVVVSRWYGGVHLGSDRFRHINNAARLVLEQSGLVKNKKK